MKSKFWLLFILFLLFFCINLIIYSNKLDNIEKTKEEKFKGFNKLFKPKCDCFNYSIGLNSSSKSNYMRPSECVLTELIDSQFSNNSIPKRVNDGSKEDKKSNNYFDDHIINVNLKDEVLHCT